MKFPFQPVERGPHIVDFSSAMVVLPMAEPGSAEIEAEYRHAQIVERLHGVEHDLVVERPAIHRMRVAHEGGICGVGPPGVEKRFQLSGWTVEKERTNSAGGVGHEYRVQRRCAIE